MMFYPITIERVPNPIITERESHYDLAGVTEPDIVRDLNAKGRVVGDAHYWAYTSARVVLNYKTRKVGTGCVLTAASVHVSINVVVPKWLPEGQPTGSVVAKWEQLSRATHAHEQQHAQIARAEAASLVELMKAHPADKSCKALDGYLQRESAALRKKSAAENEELDKRTSHGTKEGVAMSW